VSGLLRFNTNPPLRRLAKALGEAGAELTDWKPAWLAFIPLLGPAMADSLRSRGAAIGESWPALSPAWAERKARLGRGRLIGFYTGRLASELASGVARKSVTKRRLRWGPKIARAYVFHHGKGPNKKASARPFLGFTPALFESLNGILSARAEDVLSRAVAKFEGRDA
jgi:hypothetical protein